MMSESGEQLMRRFLGLWASRDAEGMVGCFAGDGIYDNVPERRPMVGHAAIRQWLDMCFRHLSRIEVDILHIAVNGEWILSERLDDHIVGDRHMRLPVMNVSRVVDGRFALFRDYYCRKTVAELGMA